MSEPKIYKYDYNEPSYPPYRMPEYSDRLINAVVETCQKEFEGQRIGFICRGSSGLYLATRCAEKLLPIKTYIIYIRKPGEENESHGSSIENYCELDTYIVIDDLVATGETIREILKEFKKRCDAFANINIGIAAKNCYENRKYFDAQKEFFKFYII